MMNALLGSVSYAAMSAGGVLPDFEDVPYVLDETRKDASYTISNAGQTLTNTTGTNDNRRWVPTTLPVPSEDQIYYWEVHNLATGPTQYDGYVGVATLAQRDSAIFGPLTFNNPIDQGSIGYRGSGTIWAENATQQVSGLATYGVNSIIMVAFNPVRKLIWFGKDGVWHRNPTVDEPASYAGMSGTTVWYPYVQGRNTNSGGTIKTIPSELSYPIPSNAKALGRTDFTYNLRAYHSKTYQVLGRMTNALTVKEAKTFTVAGKAGNGITLHFAKTYLVVDP